MDFRIGHVDTAAAGEHGAAPRTQGYTNRLPPKSPGSLAAKRLEADRQAREFVNRLQLVLVELDDIRQSEQFLHKDRGVAIRPEVQII